MGILTQPMTKLEPPDSMYLEAAKGWCELHAIQEADEELKKIAPHLSDHPLVLEVRWQVCANLEKWPDALQIANAIVEESPDWPNGWIYKASSLNEMGRFQEAYATLSQAAAKFPTDEIIPYDLACVCRALKRFDEAWTSLGRAVDLGGKESKVRALDDPDLEPLRSQIRGLKA